MVDSIRLPKDSLTASLDSLRLVREHIEFLYQMLMEQSEASLSEDQNLTDESAEAAYEELLEEYLFYQTNPVNVNSEEILNLEAMGLLNAFQVEALRQYRWQFGDLLLIEELLMIEEFDEATVAVIAPLIRFGKNEKAMAYERPTLGMMLTQGKHKATVNFARKFDGVEDDSIGVPDKDYLGSLNKLQLKYAYHYKQRLRFGIAMEKDAGEPFFFNMLSDSLQELVKTRRPPGFDFYGAHLYMSDLRLGAEEGLVVKDLALGDYQLSFGQGLTLWTGMSFGKGGTGSSVMKRASGVRPKASTGEGKFFRGVATTLRYRDLYATAFYSHRPIDATLAEADTLNGNLGNELGESLDDAEWATAMQETGYHRTLSELDKRNALQQQVFGGHLCYAGPQLEIGLTAYHLRLSMPLQLKPSKYNQFHFQGDRLTNLGLDGRWLFGHFAVFGELAYSGNGAWAGLAGMTAKPSGFVNFSVLYRNYGKAYQNLFSGAFGESNRSQAEEGIYLGLQCAPASGWELLVYCDFFRFKWLTSQVYNPSWGQEYSLKIQHQIGRNAQMQIRFKSKTKMKNSIDDQVFSHYPVFYTKRSVNFQISYGITESLTFSDKAVYSHYLNGDAADSRGYLVCHDVAYKPPNKGYSITFRYALFDSDDYNSRLSLYENDVLGAFSIPSLYGRGMRVYLLGKVKVFDRINLYARLGLTYQDRQPKTDLKIEMVTILP